MEDKTRYKYAIVRVKETSVVDFFGLIAANGYTDVSFVSNLHQTMAKADPNDDSPTPQSSKNEDRVAESEERCSLTPQSPPEEKFSSHLTNHIAMMCTEGGTNGNSATDIVSFKQEDLSAAVSSDLLSNLFASHNLPLSMPDWSSDANDSPLKTGNMSNFKQQMCLQTRMKGWQREYIKEVINNGHYPTEEELKDIEQKCDLSRKQVLRFIAKRLTNPNRKPRTDWRNEKAAESDVQNGSPE